MKTIEVVGVGAVGIGLGSLAYALLKKEPLDTPIAVHPYPMPRPEAEEATRLALLLRKNEIPFEEKRIVNQQFTMVGQSNAENAVALALQAKG